MPLNVQYWYLIKIWNPSYSSNGSWIWLKLAIEYNIWGNLNGCGYTEDLYICDKEFVSFNCCLGVEFCLLANIVEMSLAKFPYWLTQRFEGCSWPSDWLWKYINHRIVIIVIYYWQSGYDYLISMFSLYILYTYSQMNHTLWHTIFVILLYGPFDILDT